MPPAEADAQISFMQKTGWVDFVSVPSSDGDIMAYPGTTNILYKPSIENKKRAGKDHWQLWALLVLRDDIKQDRTVHFTHGADTKGIFLPMSRVSDECMIAFAALLGCDYSSAKGVGPAKLPAIIDMFTSWDRIHEFASSLVATLTPDNIIGVKCGYLAFWCHPVVDKTGTRMNYNQLTEDVRTWLGENNPAMLTALQQPLGASATPVQFAGEITDPKNCSQYLYMGCCPPGTTPALMQSDGIAFPDREDSKWRLVGDMISELPKLPLMELVAYVTSGTFSGEEHLRKMLRIGIERSQKQLTQHSLQAYWADDRKLLMIQGKVWCM